MTCNYRLGVEGFAALPGAPANRGLLDQVAALVTGQLAGALGREASAPTLRDVDQAALVAAQLRCRTA